MLGSAFVTIPSHVRHPISRSHRQALSPLRPTRVAAANRRTPCCAAEKSGGNAKKPSAKGSEKRPSQKGFFGRLKDTMLRPIVTVPGGNPNDVDLIDCVFCTGTGRNNCDACKGSGKDALGVCMMCDGKTRLTCTVCLGVGTVDRVRRGGTDDQGDFILKRSKEKSS